jgi:uncharacterized RDD family membrane protein YckC
VTTTADAAVLAGQCACGAEIRRLHPYSWCTACGEPLPSEIRSHLDNPYTRTASDAAPRQPIVVDRRFAGVWIRGLARLLDTAFGYLLSAAGGLFTIVVLTIIDAPGTTDDWVTLLTGRSFYGSVWSSMLAYAMYFAIAERVGGATVGKLLCGLRVRTIELGPAGFASTVIRALVFVIDSLFFCVIAWSNISGSPRKQRLGDTWAKTVVVHRARVEGLSAAWGRAVLGIVLGTAVMLSLDVYDNVRYVLANSTSEAPSSFARRTPTPGFRIPDPVTYHPRR